MDPPPLFPYHHREVVGFSNLTPLVPRESAPQGVRPRPCQLLASDPHDFPLLYYLFPLLFLLLYQFGALAVMFVRNMAWQMGNFFRLAPILCAGRVVFRFIPLFCYSNGQFSAKVFPSSELALCQTGPPPLLFPGCLFPLTTALFFLFFFLVDRFLSQSPIQSYRPGSPFFFCPAPA